MLFVTLLTLINAFKLKSGLLTSLISDAGKNAKIEAERVPAFPASDFPFKYIFTPTRPDIDKISKINNINRNSAGSTWTTQNVHSYLPSISASNPEHWMSELINGSPAIISELSEYLNLLINTPIKQIGKSIQGRVARRRAEKLLTKKFGWVPVKFKPTAKAVLTDIVYEFINLVCIAKAHSNAYVRDFGKLVQERFVAKTPKPAVAKVFFNSICKINAL